MTVQWTVRAANDRARRRESSPVSRAKKREAVTITASFFAFRKLSRDLKQERKRMTGPEGENQIPSLVP